MDLRGWITGEHAAVAARFGQSVVSVVPLERWGETGGVGGSSIAFLTFHVAYHEDVAVHGVLRGEPPVLSAWRDELGLRDLDGHLGLAEAEPPELTAALDVERLLPYVDAVHEATASWLADVDLARLDDQPDAAVGLDAAGVAEHAVPWLYSMWDGKPASWFVQWEAIGHRVNHVGEMVSVRNRMGLSPILTNEIVSRRSR